MSIKTQDHVTHSPHEMQQLELLRQHRRAQRGQALASLAHTEPVDIPPLRRGQRLADQVTSAVVNGPLMTLPR